MCYIELFNMLVVKYEGEIKALKLESQAATLKLSDPIWKLPEEVDGLVIEPDVVTSDKKGNVYIGDGASNRILKIDSLTGDVVTTLQLEEQNKEPIRYLFWSDTEPNLTVIHGDRISSYNIPKFN